jgi:hypothetical protein
MALRRQELLRQRLSDESLCLERCLMSVPTGTSCFNVACGHAIELLEAVLDRRQVR